MKWGCSAKTLWPSTFESQGNRLGLDGRYLGHTLERGMEIIDEESRTPWVGWRCQWCGERFQLPGEPDCYDLPLMEDVEVEELPTEVVEMTAVLWAMCASTPAVSSEAENALHQWGDGAVDLVSSWSDLAACAWMTTFKYMPRGTKNHVRLAGAEALIRTGEVTP